MIIYVIRHGQTNWNAEARFQGGRDIPLNETGRAQATGNGKALAQVLGARVNDFDYVSSPLSRATETMERVRKELGLPIGEYRTDDRLVEVCYGDWEGRTVDDLEANDADQMALRADNKWDYQPPGEHAESYEIMTWRIGSWLKTVDRDTVVTCHGGVIRSLFFLVNGLTGDEAAMIETPQDVFFKIEDGVMALVAPDAA